MSDSLKKLFRRLQDDVGDLGEALFGDRMKGLELSMGDRHRTLHLKAGLMCEIR